MSGQLQTMLAAEKPDLFWQLVSAFSRLYLAHMFVCLSLSLPRTRYNTNRRSRPQAGGLWWKVLESVVSRNLSATSWTHPRFCQQQCCYFCHCVFSPQVLSREPKRKHVNAQHMSWFAKKNVFLIQRWQQAKNRHIMAAKQTTKSDKNKNNSMLFQKSYL